MSIYSELQDVVGEIMSEFYQGVVNLIQITPGTGPADNPGTSIEVSRRLDATVKGVSYAYVKQGFALESDLTVTSSVLDGVTPTEKDFIEIDSVRYKIIKDISVPAAGVKCAWKFLVRKGG